MSDKCKRCGACKECGAPPGAGGYQPWRHPFYPYQVSPYPQAVSPWRYSNGGNYTTGTSVAWATSVS